MSAHEHARPVGGKVLDPLMLTLLGLFAISAAVMVYRFLTGVGPVSNMTDGFTWGIWEPVNVVVFTGVGAGAFGIAILCYLLNEVRYHGLARRAALVGAITYSLGGSSILVALGRYWNAVLLPVVPWWNLSSALLEVAVCVMTYVLVLWVEFLPAAFDGAAASKHPRWAAWGRRWGKRLDDALFLVVALGVLLPTMHQSSLGGLMLIAGPKIHPLWHTALLPALFLVSCLSMGFGAVVILVNILNLTWNTRLDMKLFGLMSKVTAGLLAVYVALRLGDLALAGKFRFLGANVPTLFFLVEMALFVVPALMFIQGTTAVRRGRMFAAAVMTVFGGALYRVDAYLTFYRPAGWLKDGTARPAGWDYWPSVGEIVVTVGMAAIGMAVFVFLSRKLPVVVVADRPHALEGSAAKAASH
jgi:Ni/Fe-hydrogenase subunit HybB-like protein